MINSILLSTKKVLGFDPAYTAFDDDIIMHINSALSALNQLGIGPASGFMIQDETSEWGDLLGVDPRFSLAKSYVYLRVRLAFDPPATSFALQAFQEQIKELEFRISVAVETPPTTVI